mgnify:CR=1 FL=1
MKALISRILATVLFTLVALVGTGVGAAWAQPDDTAADVPAIKAEVGPGYQALVKDNLKTLCPGGAPGDEDAPADDGLDGEEGAACDIDDAKLWTAVKKCFADVKGKPEDDEEAAGENKEKFLECMAEEGFGEKEEEEKKEDDTSSEDVTKLSMARTSASLGAFYVNSLSPVGGTDDEKATDDDAGTTVTGLDAWAGILNFPSQGGGFVGVPDRTKGESNDWLFGSSTSANTASAAYSAFDRNIKGCSPNCVGFLGTGGGGANIVDSDELTVDAGVQTYMLYGAALNGLGLDSSIDAGGGVASTAGLRGYLVLGGYIGAGMVDTVFASAIDALQWLNPFRFMVDAVKKNAEPEFTSGMDGGADSAEPDGALDGARALFGDVYDAAVSIGWMVVVPIFFAFMIFAMVMFKNSQHSSRIKKFVIMVVFMAVGLPLLGTSYTAALSSMKGASADAASSNATKVVLSTFVDFENWAKVSRLAAPPVANNGTGIQWMLGENGPSGTSEALARKYALQINNGSNPLWQQQIDLHDTSKDDSWASSMTTTEALPGSGVLTEEASAARSVKSFEAVRDLLTRYAKGATYGSGDFETDFKAGLQRAIGTGADKAERQATVATWFEQLSDPAALADMTKADVEKMDNPLIQVAPAGTPAGLQAGLADTENGQTWTFKTANIASECNANRDNGTLGSINPDWPDKSESPLLACNLSPMAMYNYLNTEFEPTKLNIYSDSANLHARTHHASVSAVGRGPAQFMYWFSAMTMLVSFAIIGFIYAMGMMFSSIKRTFQLVQSALIATAGLTAAIAKTVVYTIALLLELIGTIFIYKFIQEVIIVIPSILEKPLSEKLNESVDLSNSTTQGVIGGGAALVSLAGEGNLGTIALAITAISSIGLIVFTMMAVKMRRSMLDAIDQGITSVVNKFMDTGVGSGMAPSQPGSIRQGITRGGGMAMTSMMMSGRGLGGDGADVADTADGTGVGGAGTDGPNGKPQEGIASGAPGTGDSGSMTVGADGQMLDAAGNPVMGGPGMGGTAGAPMTVADLLPTDNSGNVLDEHGGAPIEGADGSPLAVDDVGGFDNQGRMLDDQGQALTDSKGDPLVSQSAAATSGRLMGDRALGQLVGQSGLSNYAGSIGGPSGAPVIAAPAPTPAPEAPTSKPIGTTPSADAAGSGNGDSNNLARIAAVVGVQTGLQRIGQPRKQKGSDWAGGNKGPKK